jgi:hypothetical protein
VFDEFIVKGGEIVHKVMVELFANWVVERRNMLNIYLRGRVCIESVRRSLIHVEFFILSFLSSLSFSLLFCWFAAFHVFYWSCGFSFF